MTRTDLTCGLSRREQGGEKHRMVETPLIRVGREARGGRNAKSRPRRCKD